MVIPKITIDIEENLDELDKILAEWCDIGSFEHEYYRECILNAHKPYAIIELLKEYLKLECAKMNEQNKYKVAMIIRDLKKLESPIIPGVWAHPEMQNYYHCRPWTDWTVWDIEREYLEVLMCRGETESSIAPSDEFTKHDVLEMLGLLLDCMVIYNFKRGDLFDGDYIEKEYDDVFVNTKKIRVQKL